jgi:uncharacterized repeat protein (TIGR01451 family)
MAMRRTTMLGLVALALAGGGRLMAQQPQTGDQLVVTAENLMAGDERHQAWAEQGGKATDVLPGDVVRFTLRFTNTTDQPVRDVVFSNPVPQGMRYVAGSAAAGSDSASITFSIDGGATYSTQPMIEVTDDNGRRRTVPAPPESYTHVRWTVRDWVQPGAQVTAEFRAELPAPSDVPEQ